MTTSAATASQDEDDAILDAVGKWLERDVRPHVHALEKDDIYPAEMVEQMKALGLFGATIGQAYGGLGLSATTYARIVQRVSVRTSRMRSRPAAFAVVGIAMRRATAHPVASLLQPLRPPDASICAPHRYVSQGPF